MSLRERDHLENLDVDERQYYSGSSRKILEGMEWIGSDSCRFDVNAVMNIWVA